MHIEIDVIQKWCGGICEVQNVEMIVRADLAVNILKLISVCGDELVGGLMPVTEHYRSFPNGNGNWPRNPIAGTVCSSEGGSFLGC